MSTSHDGFDRVVDVKRSNGTTSSFAYAPSSNAMSSTGRLSYLFTRTTTDPPSRW